jgi:hypothetical protein
MPAVRDRPGGHHCARPGIPGVTSGSQFHIKPFPGRHRLRASFAIVAFGGAAVLVAVRGPAPDRLGLAAYLAAVVLYVLIGIVAVAPHVVTGLGLAVAPVRVEAVLLSVLVFLGVNVAWLMLFDVAPPAGTTISGAEVSELSPGS